MFLNDFLWSVHPKSELMFDIIGTSSPKEVFLYKIQWKWTIKIRYRQNRRFQSFFSSWSFPKHSKTYFRVLESLTSRKNDPNQDVRLKMLVLCVSSSNPPGRPACSVFLVAFYVFKREAVVLFGPGKWLFLNRLAEIIINIKTLYMFFKFYIHNVSGLNHIDLQFVAPTNC